MASVPSKKNMSGMRDFQSATATPVHMTTTVSHKPSCARATVCGWQAMLRLGTCSMQLAGTWSARKKMKVHAAPLPKQTPVKHWLHLPQYDR